MYDFESLVEEVLRSKPELSRKDLMDRIEEKKNTVGAGYLTDQGALFLLAGEMGVALQQVTSSDLTLKDLYVGANDVTLVARVLGVYPVSTYNKKDGGEGRYKRVVLFDRDRVVRLTVWEEKVDEVEKLKLEVDSPVRVVSGYVKQGLDGKPNLNLGKRGSIEVIADERTSSRLARLDDMAERLERITEERTHVALDSVVSSESRYSEFVRADGSPGSLFQFGVVGQGRKEEYRVVIWSPADQPEIKVGQRVRITNVRTRRSSRGELEIHGDASSLVLLGRQAQKMEMRVCATSAAASSTLICATGREKKVRILEAPPNFEQARLGDVIEVSPDGESGDRLVCKSAESIVVKNDSSFPTLESLATKVRDAKDEGSMIMVEVIALSHGTADDVNTKDGSVVRKGELVIGDDTGEMKVVAWRELSEKLVGIQPGQRLRIVAATPKAAKMGMWTLQVSAITAVEKIRGP
jgi:replication factor A1